VRRFGDEPRIAEPIGSARKLLAGRGAVSIPPEEMAATLPFADGRETFFQSDGHETVPLEDGSSNLNRTSSPTRDDASIDTTTVQTPEVDESGSKGTAADSEGTNADATVLRDETVGESAVPLSNQEASESTETRKYEDPKAERAHRRTQQRDPSDVVELGEEINLTLKEVDYGSRPPTIIGTKNRLKVFVIDAPQDLSKYDTIRATVVDFGGKSNSAEAAFSTYVD
jgi:phosphatidate phosphatase PAH1